jgi:transcription elongation factor Elf1
MSHVPEPREPKRAEPSVLRRSATCPNCGHEPAVVFPLIRAAPAGELAKSAPLVCLNCCPRPAGEDGN